MKQETMSGKNLSLEEKLENFKKAYLQKLQQEVVVLKELLDCSEEDLQETLKTTCAIVHKISGTSGMYKLTEISEISIAFENYTEQGLENTHELLYTEFQEKFKAYLTNLDYLIANQGGSHG